MKLIDAALSDLMEHSRYLDQTETPLLSLPLSTANSSNSHLIITLRDIGVKCEARGTEGVRAVIFIKLLSL